MSELYIVTSIIGSLTATAALLSQVTFWQQKEYRLDRMLASLKSSSKTYAVIFYLSSLALVIISWTALARYRTDSAYRLGQIALLIPFSYYLLRLYAKGFSRPTATVKAILITVFSLLVILIYIYFSALPPISLSIHWATIFVLIPPSVTVCVIAVNFLTNWRKRQIIRRAYQLRHSLTGLKVVGITGSFGKTSTKHFLSQIAPNATISKEHKNALLPIAYDLLQQLNQKTETYIVEMGAYKKGEIAELARLTSPTIGLITNIGNQHLALFKSRQNIIDAKWEIITALSTGGIAVLNADNGAIVAKAKAFTGRKIWFSMRKPADVYLSNATMRASSTTFTLHLAGHTYAITAPIIGCGALHSALAAAATAYATGIPPRQIADKLKDIQPYPRTMQLFSGPKGSTIIDDTYSANKQGVISAIKHLDLFQSSDKRIIMAPLIELGKEAKKTHRAIGQALLSSRAKIYVYGTGYRAYLDGTSFTNPQRLCDVITKNISAQTVFLLEGRLPEIIRSKLSLT